MAKDTERAGESEKNPYRLPPEALRPPEEGVEQWFENLVALQREGIDQGEIPQNIRCVTEEMEEKWRIMVWNYRLSKLSPEERARIMATTRPGKSRHWLGRG